MQTLSIALGHVQRNYVALLIYAAIIAAYLGLRVAIENWLIADFDLSALDSNANARYYILGAGVTTAATAAIGQAIAFLRMGEDIERPVWKVRQQPGALARFWGFWFTINLIAVTSSLLINLSPLELSTKESMQILYLFAEALLVPFGATVMFFGGTSRTDLANALSMMFHQLPGFLIIALLNFMASTFLTSLIRDLPSGALPALGIVSCYLDCFVFAFCWELCRNQREIEENMDDLDF